MRKWPRILFFILGALPTAEEVGEAEALGFNVVFRNALLVPAEGALEACDGVAGEVPERYAAAFPSAEEVLEEFKAGSSFEKTEKVEKKAEKVKEPKAPEGKAPVPNASAAWKPNA